MGKVKCFMDESFYILIMAHFSLLMSKIRVKEVKHHYHYIKLSKYNKSFFAVEENYCRSIVALRDSMESRLTDHKDSPVFENLVDLLKTKA